MLQSIQLHKFSIVLGMIKDQQFFNSESSQDWLQDEKKDIIIASNNLLIYNLLISLVLYAREYLVVQLIYIMQNISDMQHQITQYLQQPSKNARPQKDQNPLFAYLITYIGQIFIQGYRLIENYGSVLLFSLMQYQFSDQQQRKNSRGLKKIPPRFKLLLWQIGSKNIFEDGKNRRENFNKMTTIGDFLEDVQYHIIYLRQRRYSIVPYATLEKNSIPQCYQYFKKIQWIEQKNGCRPICEKEQGIQLHRLVESFIKGAGEGRNLDLIKRMQRDNKFVYDLFKVINTVCYIVGKEILQNDFQTMSVEKWMRKYTEKKFKRYDLLMRGEHKCSIVDWKFTRLDAQEKIKGAGTNRKNEIYYQLAKKDFKTEIQLKFYCIHQRIVNHSYHCFTTAKFNYQIQTVELDGNDKKQKNIERIEEAAFKQISIQDSLIDQVPDVPGGQTIEKQLPVILIDNSDQDLIEHLSGRSIVNPRLQNNQNEWSCGRSLRIQENKINILQIQQIQLLSSPKSQRVLAKKQRLKMQKRILKQKANLLQKSAEIFDIESD